MCLRNTCIAGRPCVWEEVTRESAEMGKKGRVRIAVRSVQAKVCHALMSVFKGKSFLKYILLIMLL